MENLKLVPLTLFALFSGKLLIFGANLEQALICAVLGGVSSYFYFKSNEVQMKEFKEQISYMQKAQEEQKKELDELKTYVSGVKMAQNMRTTGTPGIRSF